MARVVLASAVARWLPPALADVDGRVSMMLPGATVAAVLAQLFVAHPGLRSYVVEERGVVRRHVAIFVDGESIRRRRKDGLDQTLGEHAELQVLQALSGG